MKKQVLDFEDLIEAEFRKLSKIPLKERIIHYSKWTRHNKLLTIAGGIALTLGGGLCYELTRWLLTDSTTNEIVKNFIWNGGRALESAASSLVDKIDATIDTYYIASDDVKTSIANLESAYETSNSSEILELKNSLQQNLHLFESGNPTRPAYEFVTRIMPKLKHLENQYKISHGSRAFGYVAVLLIAGLVSLPMLLYLKRWKDEDYNKKVQNSKDLTQKIKSLLPQIYADLSAYDDRHILFGIIYRYLNETKDADVAFRFLTSMRSNADTFFKDISDLYQDDYETIRRNPSSILEIISKEDILGIVNAYAGVSKGKRLVRLDEEPDEEKEQLLHEDLVTFDSIGGYESIKEELKLYALAVNNPYEAAMNGVNLETGIILWGPPGTGKTLLAQAFIHDGLNHLGDEMQKHWTQISGADIKSKWVGQSEQNVQALYLRARKNPPYIIFIDEGDVLFASRDEVHEYNREVITQFLTEIGGTKRADRITTLVTTNRRESFDTASTRYGRLGTKIPVDLPDEYGRRQIFAVHLNGLNRINLVENLDYDALIKETNGFSGADIAGVIESVFKQRYKEIRLGGAHPYNLTNSHFIEAIRSYERTKEEEKPVGFTRTQVKSREIKA